MADDETIRVAALRSRMNVDSAYEVRYWTKELKCTATELRDAVREIGPMADDICAYLKKREG